jgi:Tfp pilus assembly protein PilV
MKRRSSNRGFSIVEAIVASALCLGVLLGIAGAFSATLQSAFNNTPRVQASFLEEEGLEAVRVLRDNGWAANIAAKSTATNLYLTFTGGTWQWTATNTFVDSTFERKVVLDSVNRDGSQNIVSSGGSVDNAIRKVTVTVSWRQGNATTSKSLVTYLTNIFNN